MASVDAEFEVLAALLRDATLIDTLQLSPNDFFDVGCREAYVTIAKMADAGTHVDVVTLAEALPANGAVDRAGGLAWLGGIVSNALGSIDRAGSYAKIVKAHSDNRRLAAASVMIHEIAATRGLSPDEKVARADDLIQTLSADAVSKVPSLVMHSALEGYLDVLNQRDADKLPGMSTGLTDLDELIGGIKTKDFIVIGARPSMGKTALATGIGVAVASLGHSIYGDTHGVLMLSQEMPTNGIVDRAVASVGSIPLDRLLRGALTEDDYTRLAAAIGRLHKLPFWINDQPALTLGGVRAKLRERRKDNIKVLIIDYLQLMNGEGVNRNTQIETISRGLKQLAKEFDVAVIALSQLSRKIEERADKRPMMSDLRDSGSIEQDADIIMFVYRDEVYKPDTADKGIAELIVGKNRNGPLGTVRTHFRGEYTRFDTVITGAF